MSDFEIIYPEGVKITVGGQERNLRPLVFGKRVKLIKMIGDILLDIEGIIPEIRKGDFKIESMVVPFVKASGERMRDIYALVLGEEATWIEENLTVPEEMGLVMAIVEVNQLPFLVAQVKALEEKTKPKTSGS